MKLHPAAAFSFLVFTALNANAQAAQDNNSMLAAIGNILNHCANSVPATVLDPIRGKISLNLRSDDSVRPTPEILANDHLPTRSEQAALKRFLDATYACDEQLLALRWSANEPDPDIAKGIQLYENAYKDASDTRISYLVLLSKRKLTYSSAATIIYGEIDQVIRRRDIDLSSVESDIRLKRQQAAMEKQYEDEERQLDKEELQLIDAQNQQNLDTEKQEQRQEGWANLAQFGFQMMQQSARPYQPPPLPQTTNCQTWGNQINCTTH